MSAVDGAVIEGAVEVRPAPTPIAPQAWADRCAAVIAALAANGVDIGDVGAVVAELVLYDPAGTSWRYDSARWQRWDGARWEVATPQTELRVNPFTLDQPVPPDAEFAELDEDDAPALAADSVTP